MQRRLAKATTRELDATGRYVTFIQESRYGAVVKVEESVWIPSWITHQCG